MALPGVCLLSVRWSLQADFQISNQRVTFDVVWREIQNLFFLHSERD